MSQICQDNICIETSPVHRDSSYNHKFNFPTDANKILPAIIDENVEKLLTEHDMKSEQNSLLPKNPSMFPLSHGGADNKPPARLEQNIVDFLSNPTPTRHKNNLNYQITNSHPEREHRSVKDPSRALHIPAFNPERSVERRHSKQVRGPVENRARYHLEPSFKSKSQSLIGVQSLNSIGQRSFESEIKPVNRQPYTSESEYSDKASLQKYSSPGSETDSGHVNNSPQIEGQDGSRSDEAKRMSLCEMRNGRTEGSIQLYKKNFPVSKTGFNISREFFSKKKSQVYGVVSIGKKRPEGISLDGEGPVRHFKKKDPDSVRDRQSPDSRSEVRNSGGKIKATKS